MEQYYQILGDIAAGTDSSLILFFVIAAVVVAPVYVVVLKGRNERHKGYIEREREIIAVIQDNSAVMAGLKTLLTNNGADAKSGIKRINERLDALIADGSETKATAKAILEAVNSRREVV